MPQVEEPLFRRGIFQNEFDEVAEPKELSTENLAGLVKTYGSYIYAANAIWAIGCKDDMPFIVIVEPLVVCQ